MTVIYYVSVTLHVLEAMLWLGGMFFLGVVGAPVLRAMISVSAVHDVVYGPQAGRASPGSPGSLRLRRRAVLLGRVNALLGVVVVAAAVHLARGG